MEVEYSKHWVRKHLRKRKDITQDMIKFAIKNSNELKDKHWISALNSISKIPSSGRKLKVVYRKTKEKIFIVTAFWLD